ncbi:MAG: primosomal protein N' [Deltaproteobacteria bacterium]|nr:primosomal protein N' [Deltaproteobacteria bacterium]
MAVLAPVRGLFSYRLPGELEASIGVGQLVEVPFGRSRRRGVIVEICDGRAEPEGLELKPICGLVQGEWIDPALLRTLLWSADYYLAPPGEMVFAALPPAFRKLGRLAGASQRQAVLPVEPGDASGLTRLQDRAPLQARVLRAVQEAGEVLLADLEQRMPGARAAVRALEAKGLVRREARELLRDPPRADLPAPKAIEHLGAAQQRALDAVCQALDAQQFGVQLLHGVTGSGKTEVYLRAIAHALRAQRGAILLVPEISLTPQLLSRVRDRFGRQVAVLHSALGSGERLDEWRRLKTGRARVAVGARSAVFAPVQAPGLIVVDEEHDSSYKQSERLPYHGRDLAIIRGREESAVVLLGSATPSLESFHHARSGRYRLLEMDQRIDGRAMPEIELVDLRQLVDPLERSQTLSPRLAEALAEALDRNEQAILFLNRRGYSSFALCRDCGQTLRCDNCSVALVHHLASDQLCCHYCGLSRKLPERCPTCARGRMQLFGLGTEKCEQEVRRRFPGARVLRLDSDSVSGRGKLDALISRFARGKADVLVGTQMVTKGHDIPGVTLVGVLLADLGLHLPDFRAAERSFQLLTQVAGRAGRGERPGRVIVQTFLPEHESIVLAREGRFVDFFERELARRQALGYPPAGRLLLVRTSCEDAQRSAELARQVAASMRRHGPDTVRVLGPVASPLSRIRGRYRWQLLVKCERVGDLQRVAQAALRQVRVPAGAKILFDVDPVDML